MSIRSTIAFVTIAATTGTAISIALSVNAAGQQTPQIVRAQGIELTDANGNTRIRLAINANTGAAGITIYDNDGAKPRLVLGLLANGTSDIELLDPDAKRRATFNVSADNARLGLVGPAGNANIVVSAGADALALVFNDAAGRSRAVLGLAPDGTADLTFYDGSNKHAVAWSAPPQSASGTKEAAKVTK
jgi:hypothetical protein